MYGEMHDAFLDANGQFCIAVAIAATIRLTQSPPFFEISFMESLIAMQFLGLLSTSIAAVAILLEKRQQQQKKMLEKRQQQQKEMQALEGVRQPENEQEVQQLEGMQQENKEALLEKGGPEIMETPLGGARGARDEDASGGRETPWWARRLKWSRSGRLTWTQRWELEKTDELPTKRRRLLAIALYLVVDLCFCMGLTKHLRISEASWTIIQQLTAACRQYGSIQSGFNYVDNHKLYVIKIAGPIIAVVVVMLFLVGLYTPAYPPEKTPGNTLEDAPEIALGNTLEGAPEIALGNTSEGAPENALGNTSESAPEIALGNTSEGAPENALGNTSEGAPGNAPRNTPRNTPKKMKEALKKAAQNCLWPILVATSLASAIGSFYCMVQLEHKRSAMKAVTGDGFTDDQWGFGQVVALFLWAPVLVEFLFVIFHIATTLICCRKIDDSRGDVTVVD